MKPFVVAGVVVILGFIGGFVPDLMRGRPAAQAFRMDEAFEQFQSRLLPEHTAGQRYDAVVQVQNRSQVSPGARVRIYLDAVKEDKRYLAVEVSAASAQLLAVEQGICQEVAAYQGQTAEAKGVLPTEIRVKRRPPQLSVVCDGRTVLRAVCESQRGGVAGVGTTPGVTVAGPYLQPVGSIVAADDFMRGTEETSDWARAGKATWEVRSLDNPGRSSNAFIYQGWGMEGGLSLLGRPYWDAYRVEVSVLGDRKGEVGLVLAAGPAEKGAKPSRYALIRWSAAPRLGDDAKATGPGRLELVEVFGGKERVLASHQGGYQPGQWYRLGGTVRDGWVRAYVDGHEVLGGHSAAFSGGRSGLYVKSQSPTEFDDFRVVSLEGTNKGDAETRVWQFFGGRWQGAGGRLRGVSSPAYPVYAITGGEAWANMQLQVQVDERAAGAAPYGLVAAFRDPANYVAYEVDGKQERLVRMREGKAEVLAATPLEGRPTSLVFAVDRGALSAGGLSAFLPDLPSGRVGVMVGPAGGSAPVFSGFSATSIEPPRPVVSVNEIFDDERLMKIWSGTAGDWKGNRGSAGTYERAFWHRALFYGDSEIEALLPEQRRDEWTAALSLAKPVSSKHANNGYVLIMEHAAPEAKLRLVREGDAVESVGLKAGAPVQRLRLRQAGPYLLGYVDDQLRLMWRDKRPLHGPKVAWAAKGIDIEPEGVQIYNRELLDYSFNKASADWRRAGGVWQVTNRWECDPRWSFMAGMAPFLAKNRAEHYMAKLTPGGQWKVKSLKHQLALLPDATSKLAALWHKGEFGGDFVMECFVGPMHQLGVQYGKSVKNFCITACGDGRDLTHGYNCIFGGWDNTRSAILRDGKTLKETMVKIPVRSLGNIHRMWFRMRVERRGQDLLFSVHTQPRNNTRGEQRLFLLAVKDNNPPTGKRLAIWTYDFGLMLARCRIAGPGPVHMEDPFVQYPLEARCLYTTASK